MIPAAAIPQPSAAPPGASNFPFSLPDPAAVMAAIAAKKAAAALPQPATPPSGNSTSATPLIGTPDDIARVKTNIQKMADQGAGDDEIEGYVKSEGYTAQQLASAPQAQPDKPIMESLGSPRGANLAIRSTLKGAASLPYLGADALTGLSNLAIKGYNAATGSNVTPVPLPSAGENQTLNDWFGTPQGWENVPAEATEFAASVPTFAGAAAASGSKVLAPLAEKVGSQLIGAAAGGASGGTVRATMPPDSPLTPWAELAASIAGGAAGGMAGSIGSVPGSTAQSTMDAMTRSGIKPSLGDVTQNPLIQVIQKGIEPFASGKGVLPGTYVPEQEAARLSQAQGRAATIGQQYGTPMPIDTAGSMMQQGVKDYRYAPAPAGMTPSQIITAPTWQTSISAKADALYSKIPIGPNATVPVPQTAQTLSAIASKYSNPDLQQAMGDPTIAKWNTIITNANGQLSWSDLRNLRTDIRYLRANPSLTATVDDRALSQLNQSLTNDMQAGAFHIGGAPAERAVTRADNYYSAAMSSVGKALNSVFKAPTAEQAYGQFARAVTSGTSGDVNKVAMLKGALGPDEWGDLVSTWLDRASNPNPGQAGVPGHPQFSVSTFLTNYNSLSPTAKQLMFNGTGQSQLKSSLDDLVTSLGAMRGTDKMANTSKTATHGLVGAGVLEAFHQQPAITAGVVAGANVGARFLYNPTFIKLMTMGVRATSPQMKAAFVAQAARVAQGNPALAQDVQSLVQSVTGQVPQLGAAGTTGSPGNNNQSTPSGGQPQ